MVKDQSVAEPNFDPVSQINIPPPPITLLQHLVMLECDSSSDVACIAVLSKAFIHDAYCTARL